MGHRIDTLFIESLEAVTTAAFLSQEEKIPFILISIRKLDTLKLLLLILWETKSLYNTKYIALSMQLDEVGRMLGGWRGQLQKQNSLAKREK